MNSLYIEREIERKPHSYTKSNQPIKSQDNIFNTTFNLNDQNISPKNEKIIQYIKTSHGSTVNHVPTFKFEIPEKSYEFDNFRESWPYNNHLKIKLHNPINQLKRNASSLSNSFS